MTVERVTEADLPELLGLMRGYCDFYGVAPSDEALLDLARALLAGPQREGVQVIARGADGAALGFATVFWSWSTLSAARLAVMNDLYVSPHARGARIGEALISACLDEARAHGAARLGWQTALDNTTAQRLYDRVGGRRSTWLDYELPT